MLCILGRFSAKSIKPLPNSATALAPLFGFVVISCRSNAKHGIRLKDRYLTFLVNTDTLL